MRLFDPGASDVGHPTPRQMTRRIKQRRSQLTVGELVERYLRHVHRAGKHGPDTIVMYERALAGFVTQHGPCRCADLFPHHLTNYIDGHEEWRSAWTRKRHAAIIRAVFQWACDEVLIRSHPFVGCRYQPGERRPDMPDDVFERLCRAANKRAEWAFRFLRLTGRRCCEARRAEWPHIRWASAEWVIYQHKARRKSRKEQIAMLVPEALALLRTIRGSQPEAHQGHIFLNNKNRPWGDCTLNDYLTELKERLGIAEAATLHGVRHRFGSAAVINGAPLKLISQQLGHASVQTTEDFYVHLEGAGEAILAAAKMAQPPKTT